MRYEPIGFALCGSFCTHAKALTALEELCREYANVTPILSEACRDTDTRFGSAAELSGAVEAITGRRPLQTIPEVEPIGPKGLLDALVIAPCTGNTLAKLALGITDTTVAMAAKAHLRNQRPLVLALSTNDGLGASAANIGSLLVRQNVYFVPFRQDDPVKKPRSLVADFGRLPEAVAEALRGRQLQPILA